MMTIENLSKLPKWAQTQIRIIERQRESAIIALNEHLDSQTPSPFYFEDMVCTGEETGPSFKKNYVQASRFTVEHGDVKLDIYLRNGNIDLQWDGQEEVALIPSSYQQARLVAKKNMR